ncbi:hypothetical protein B0H21DRAFT_823283 [Amylocystis lapponica]|nr:hypothetical protein B0H21DRAFT_823283 [Amylocystis lapponica]
MGGLFFLFTMRRTGGSSTIFPFSASYRPTAQGKASDGYIHNVQDTAEFYVQFWTLRNDTLDIFGTKSPEHSKLELHNVAQTSATFEPLPLELVSAKLRSLSIYRNRQHLPAIPFPSTITSMKLSGLVTEFIFQLVLYTTAMGIRRHHNYPGYRVPEGAAALHPRRAAEPHWILGLPFRATVQHRCYTHYDRLHASAVDVPGEPAHLEHGHATEACCEALVDASPASLLLLATASTRHSPDIMRLELMPEERESSSSSSDEEDSNLWCRRKEMTKEFRFGSAAAEKRTKTAPEPARSERRSGTPRWES